MSQDDSHLPEPWLRGTLAEVPAVPRAVLHAFEQAKEDLWKWCLPLTEQQFNDRPGDVAPVSFHLRHIARSLDRLLTYAEDGALNESQFLLLQSEVAPNGKRDELFAELEAAFARSAERVRRLSRVDPESQRHVGKKQLPTTVGGLLVHIADHTLRHVGQAITTAKFVAKL